MEGFELATIFVAPSDFQNFGETDPRTLMAVLGGPNPFFTIPPSDAVWARGGPEASQDLFGDLLRPHLGTSGGLCWDLFSLLSSLFSLLSSLGSLPSSLAAAVSDRTSHPPLRTSHQAIDSAPSCLDPSGL